MSVTVRDALERGALFIAYQPIIDLSRRRVFGYEALVRSTAPEFPNPPSLLAAAIKSGFLGQLGRALRQLALDRCPDDAALFLNIHPDEFDEQWLVRPDDAWNKHANQVFLEITETVPISHYRYCHSVLKEIRMKGVRLAVDDLGAGYSNLKYIADLSPEIVKLDRELIAGLTVDSRLHRLVRSIVNLCEDLGARVVAEGIETAEEMRAVLATGTHYGQGYYLARPHREPPRRDWAAVIEGRQSQRA